ncbi:MAG TPA: helix-turn-helix domain-containing protein [Solirubrobacteraceae bacterium]|nr:helix-turn-helix domain-containing protein [Solirubrobacteraceae bacterium]
MELLLHPVRTRIIHALSGGRIRTTTELADRLWDVSRATVYRQVAVLVDGGILEVAGERRVRGAIERRYRLRGDRARVSRDTAETMSIQRHREAFASATAVLVAEFNAYLDQPNADPVADRAGYVQVPLWLTPRELAGVQQAIVEAIAANQENAPSSRRRPYLISPIVFPIDESEQGGGETGQ